MKQDIGEPISSFAARLCGFTKEVQYTRADCDGNAVVDFTEIVVTGDIVRSLADPEIKTIVLGEVEQKTQLEDLVALIQAKEYGRTSASTSNVGSGVSAVEKSSASYPNCGNKNVKGDDWKDNCPAANKTCENCDKTGHFARVCRSKKKVPNAKATHMVEDTT